MPIDPSMDVEEQFLAFLRGDTSLEDARGAASIQLVVVDQVPFSPACEAPSFSLVVWYHPHL
jgi:hypothetical protein